MKKEIVPKKIFEMLVKHLVNTEEQKDRILSEYFSAFTAEQVAFEGMITDYIKKIEEYIASHEIGETVEVFCPFVIIGSIVEIENMQFNEVDKYQIVSPFENDIGSTTDTASYLAPMGKAMLLKKLNEVFIVETPVGRYSYKIKSIDMFGNIALQDAI